MKYYKKIHFSVLPFTKHLVVEAQVNTIKGRFILDTGASTSCIAENAIEKFNLELEKTTTKAAGAGAIDIDAKCSNGNFFKIGKWQKTNFSFVVFNFFHVNTALQQQNELPVDGIIGADILVKSNAIINYGNNNLYLK